jgi:hypothetical protein
VVVNRVLTIRDRVVLLAALALTCTGLVAGSSSAAEAGPVQATPTSGPAGKDADFNGDGFADLTVWSETNVMEDFEFSSGAVHVIYGSPNGLRAAGNQVWAAKDFNREDDSLAWGSAFAAGDFDGDGYSDLAVGDPGPGSVRILYGSARGLTKARTQLWTQDSPGIADRTEVNDGFGNALTAANLGRGPQDDLAIGVTWENCNSGAVNVIYGSPSGLAAAGNTFWTQDSAGIPGSSEGSCAEFGVGDLFGASLTAGAFAGGAFADLAIGAPGEDVGAVKSGGAVTVLYGSPDGLTAAGAKRWTQNSGGIAETAETGDAFGASLIAASFRGGRYADLAVGVASEKIGRAVDTGAVHVLYGSRTGLTATGSQLWSQATPGVKGRAEAGDSFGHALAVGDFGRNAAARSADLAIGAYAERVGRLDRAGSVHVLYGSPKGLSAAGDQTWTQNSPGIRGAAETTDLLGVALAAGNFGKNGTGPGYDDLVAGAAADETGNDGSGGVNVIYGARGGLTASGNQFWDTPALGLGDGRYRQDFGLRTNAGCCSGG